MCKSFYENRLWFLYNSIFGSLMLGGVEELILDFMEIKDKLDQMILSSYDHEAYYYYAIYTTDGRTINCLMDYEDTTVCGQPIHEFGDNEYTQVLVTGETYTVSEISSYGSWMFTLLPVRDDSGSIIAFIEVGSSLDKAVQERRELVVENIITVICSCGVMIMLILECIFVLSFFEKRKRIPRAQWDITQQMPIRLMVFLSYMTDSMQDEAGMGNAMGIYAMFENTGQTLGPVVYGAALTLGNRKGILVLFLLMFLLVCLFWGADRKRRAI